MKLTDIPIIKQVVRFGGNDRVLDALILLGPVLIAGIALVGRTPVTTVLAAAYVVSLPVYVLYLSRSI